MLRPNEPEVPRRKELVDRDKFSVHEHAEYLRSLGMFNGVSDEDLREQMERRLEISKDREKGGKRRFPKDWWESVT